jgi:hypothetical protein
MSKRLSAQELTSNNSKIKLQKTFKITIFSKNFTIHFIIPKNPLLPELTELL